MRKSTTVGVVKIWLGGALIVLQMPARCTSTVVRFSRECSVFQRLEATQLWVPLATKPPAMALSDCMSLWGVCEAWAMGFESHCESLES
jgi:hypothetical protein